MVRTDVHEFNSFFDGIVNDRPEFCSFQDFTLCSVSIVRNNCVIRNSSFRKAFIYIAEVGFMTIGLEGFQLVAYLLADAVIRIKSVEYEEEYVHFT